MRLTAVIGLTGALTLSFVAAQCPIGSSATPADGGPCPNNPTEANEMVSQPCDNDNDCVDPYDGSQAVKCGNLVDGASQYQNDMTDYSGTCGGSQAACSEDRVCFYNCVCGVCTPDNNPKYYGVGWNCGPGKKYCPTDVYCSDSLFGGTCGGTLAACSSDSQCMSTCTAGTCDEYNSGANTCGAFGDKSSLEEGAPEPMPVGASQRARVKAKKSKFGSFADLFR